MIRILGSVLNVSFQTELLIMTLLGLANSTLDWKPFEVVSQLNRIEDLHFSPRSDGQISGNFISWIKKLLTFTVVVQFFCSLLNPLVSLLKLYPIITWSRADVLLPWLTIHALNTILPKLMSLVLAFVFYFESMISTVSLLEFLLVESINLVVAWCNWYLFFDFYMDLRTIEREHRQALSAKVHRSLRESRKSSYTLSSSIPNLKREARASSADWSDLRTVRSLDVLSGSPSRSFGRNRRSVSTLSSDEALTPAEKTIRILNLTDEELQSARVRKGSLNKVLSNADTVDVELIDLVSPDTVSFVSVANTDESVIIVFDSQDEKELDRILASAQEDEFEVDGERRRETVSDIADEDLLMELLDIEDLADIGKLTDEQSINSLVKVEAHDLLEDEKVADIEGSIEEEEEEEEEDKLAEDWESNLPEENKLAKSRKSTLTEEEKLSNSRKSTLTEEEKLANSRKSTLTEEEKLAVISNSKVPAEENVTVIRQSNVSVEETVAVIRKSNVSMKENVAVIRKSSVSEEKNIAVHGKSNLSKEEKLTGVRKSNLPEEVCTIKKPNLVEEERSLKDKERYSIRERDMLEVKTKELPREEKLFKNERPNFPRREDEFRECVCSSSEDDEDDEENEAPVNVRPENFLKRPPVKAATLKGDDFKPKERYYVERKKTRNRIAQTVDYPEIPLNTILRSPSSALVPRGSNQCDKGEEKDLHCLLNENFQILDEMCRNLNFSNNNQSIPNNSLRKWLIFRNQLESSLDSKTFLKKNGSTIDLMKPRPIGYFNVKDKNTQTEATLKAKKRHKEKHGVLLHYPKTEVIESKWNYVENYPGTSSDLISKGFPTHKVDVSIEPSKVSDVSEDKIPHVINIVNFSKTTSTSRSPLETKLTKVLEPSTKYDDDREKTNISIIKTKVPVKCSELDHSNGRKDRDLQNLQAYNKLTLEQDKREMIQKKKKSKMTSYKNAVTELTLRNSDIVPHRPVKVDHRTCKSNHSRVQDTGHSQEPKNRNVKQLFKYNEKLLDQPVETSEAPKKSGLEFCEDKSDHPIASRSDTDIPSQGRSRQTGEGLEHLEWLDPSGRTKLPQIAPGPNEPRHTVIVDDETVSMLKCAFSFSDESERGFQLGPEMHEPYPIFQVVALTMAEIFKTTGWRNFVENPLDEPVADVMFCEAEVDCDIGDQVADVIDELIRAGEEELERRKCLSLSLLEQLHDLLNSSRETLSEVENSQPGSQLDLLDELCVTDGDLVGDVKPVETCVYTLNEQVFSNPLKEPREPITNSTNQKSELPAEAAVDSETSPTDGGSSSGNRRDSRRGGAKSQRSRVHETKFENKVQKHHCRKGEGLSSGNVMEFDSEGRALNVIDCRNDEAISEEENGSNDELLETFNSFCDRLIINEESNVELEKNLKTLAKSDKFVKFVTLLEEADSKIFKEKEDNEDEVVLSNSDFASGETVIEVFKESAVEEPSNSDEVKDESPAKLKDKECNEIANAFPTKNLELPSADIGKTNLQKLKEHREYLESNAIKQRILNWRNESVDSMNSFDYPKRRKLEETRSFSDNSDIEEFPMN